MPSGREEGEKSRTRYDTLKEEMEDLDPCIHALAGYEFDWLAIDREGFVALCETGGFGEVPEQVLRMGVERLADYGPAIQSILTELPEVGRYQQRSGGVGTDTQTLNYAARGLYIYDWRPWKGPYRRIVVPDRPAHHRLVQDVLSGFADGLPRLPVSFRSTKRFHLAKLLPCRSLH